LAVSCNPLHPSSKFTFLNADVYTSVYSVS
jgi:hypothetical protein